MRAGFSFGETRLTGFYIRLRILYDLFFYDSAVEGSFWTYVSARIGNFARNHWGRGTKRRASERIVIKNRLGVFEIDASNDTLAKSCPYFEHWLHGWIPPAGKMFVDIGANIGLYSFLALKSRGYENAIAFEPNPATYATLSKNIRLNALEGRITAEKLALGSSNAQLLLQMERYHTGASRIVAKKNADLANLVPVAQTTLDAYVDEHRIDPAQISYLKIDVEGFEHQTVRGASATLARMSRGSRVQVEVWGSQRRKQDVLRLLAEAGFTMIDACQADYLFEKR